jgi:hypothetical protein
MPMMPLMILRCAWAGVALKAQAATTATQMVETEPANPVRSMNTPYSVKMQKTIGRLVQLLIIGKKTGCGRLLTD